MISSVWAGLYHVSSSDQNPQHHLCPDGENSWCDYNKNPESYEHTHGLPDVIVNLIEPIYENLTEPTLLGRCMHGGTQNPNEALNNLIWERCAKQVWVGRRVVEEATYQSISHFNDGYVATLQLFKFLGTEPGLFTTKGALSADSTRIRKAQAKNSDVAKSRRKVIRAQRKGYLDKKTQEEGVMYQKGF